MPSPAPASFRQQVRAAGKLLVVDFGFLGDSVQLIPTLCELKRHHPQAQLHVLTTRVGGEVLRMVPAVDRVWDVELMPDRRTLREQLNVLRGLRSEHFDAALNFSGSDRSLFWTWFSGARQRATYTWGTPHWWTHHIIPTVVPSFDPDLPIAEQRRRVLEHLGYDTDPLRYELTPGTEAETWAAELVPPNSIHLSINAAKALKEWPLDHSIELAQRILDRWPNMHLIASGSAREREQHRLRELADQVASNRLHVLPGSVKLRQLAAALQRCSLHIGPDSGVMNLAAALGVPTISFFRNQPGYRAWLPTGEQHHSFVGECHCVDHRSAPCLAGERAECLVAISVDAVLQTIASSLVKSGRGSEQAFRGRSNSPFQQ
jgi:ADP-heptose:LPS heptosyltransferase